MVEVLTYVFMGISIGSIGLNIPLVKKYLANCRSCNCRYVGENGRRCSSDCKNVKEQVKPKCMTETAEVVDVVEVESKNESDNI